MVFGGLLLVKPSFSREKDGFSNDGCSKQSFSREKDGFEPKNHLFLEKISKTMGLGPSRDGFFGFLEKKMVFLVRNHLFLEKKMVVEQPLFEKPSFSRENDGFWRSCPGKTIFFSRKRWFLEVLSW